MKVQKLFHFYLGIPNARSGNGMNALYSIRCNLLCIVIHNNDIIIIANNYCAVILGIVMNNNLVPTTWRGRIAFLWLLLCLQPQN